MPSDEVPDFYTGAPLTPEDLLFRSQFIAELWEYLETQHLILSAPRRTGKTSVMDHLAARPEKGWAPISVFVQDITHPADFVLLMLDLFHERYSRIEQYYPSPKREAAYALLAKLSVGLDAIARETLFAEFERILHEAGHVAPLAKRRQLFNQLMRDLENDFYVVELAAGDFDFASGLIKQWWKKYYA